MFAIFLLIWLARWAFSGVYGGLIRVVPFIAFRHLMICNSYLKQVIGLLDFCLAGWLLLLIFVIFYSWELFGSSGLAGYGFLVFYLAYIKLIRNFWYSFLPYLIF